jgi:hypothetical protein
MAREEIVLRFVPDELERSIRLLDPPGINDPRHDRFMRDIQRTQWLAHGNGFNQTPDYWVGFFEQEEYVSTIRYLERVGWKRDITGLIAQ